MEDPTAPVAEPLSLVGRALAYAAAGTPVFPCRPSGKSPITAHGFRDATTDPDRIRAWWSLTPLADIAAPTGHPGFDVLDVRASGKGWPAFRRARAAGGTSREAARQRYGSRVTRNLPTMSTGPAGLVRIAADGRERSTGAALRRCATVSMNRGADHGR